MFWQGLRNVQNKFNERIVKSKGSLATRIDNRIHRRTVYVTMCLLLVVILGTMFNNLVSSKPVAYANSIRGDGVEIYWDQDCTNRTFSLDWGVIEPGSNRTVMVYVRNEGDSAVSLWITTSNWKPSVSSGYMTLIETYSGRILNSNEVIPMYLLLDVSHSISEITDFSFDIVITSSG